MAFRDPKSSQNTSDVLNKKYHSQYEEGKINYEYQKTLADVPGEQNTNLIERYTTNYAAHYHQLRTYNNTIAPILPKQKVDYDT